MKSFLYDESETATIIYNNGFTNGYDRREAYLLAKYFRHILGYGDIRIKKKIIEFCSKEKYFNSVTEASRIKSFVKNSKHEFVINTSVFITKDEIDRVRPVKSFDAQKVYLALLVIARRNGSINVPIKNITEIKKMAGLSCTNLEIQVNLFNILYTSNLIYPIVSEKGGRKNGYQKLLKMDFDGKPEILIHNDKEIYELGKTYEKYCGGYLIYCQVCKKEMIRKGSNHRLCEEHFIEKERVRKR